jgi:xanthine dehydrogenase accessory factor
MRGTFARLLSSFDVNDRCVWVIVADAQGSTPRETGASMIVTKDRSFDTIGGGHLELKAIEFAREQLRSHAIEATARHFPLGPTLGQCCGGRVSLLFVPIDAARRTQIQSLQTRAASGEPIEFTTQIDTGELVTVTLPNDTWNIAVFGAGHVGKAIVDVLCTLPCQITWIDEREAEFPSTVAPNVRILNTDTPADEVRRIPAGAQVLVLTHSHALDFDICFALLKRVDLAYCGLIGSATKAATFRKRFEQRSVSAEAIARIICPIGRTEIKSKHPGAIAVSVARRPDSSGLEDQNVRFQVN